MEMTGLDPVRCRILEVAAVVTDLDLSILGETDAVVRQPRKVLDGMDPWCVKTHGASGLTKASASGRPLKEVEAELVAFVKKHFRRGERPVLCGNSIHQDRKFIDRYLKKLAALLHYRMVDVTSFKEILRSKHGLEFEKRETHRARDDIHESIAELRYYLGFFRGA